MTSRLTRFGFALGAGALLLSGCAAADNGVKNASASDIVTKVKAAMVAQKTVEITGDADLSGKPAHLDLKIDLARATIDGNVTLKDGGKMAVVLVNKHLYMTMDKTLAEQFAGGSSSVAQLLSGKCIDVGDVTNQSSGSPLSGIGWFGNLGTGNLTDSLFKDKSYTKGSVKTINGTEVLALTDSKGELDIATHGDALPIQAVTKSTDNTSPGNTTISFSNWGKLVNASAPSDCVSLEQLMSQFSGSSGSTPSASPKATIPSELPTP